MRDRCVRGKPVNDRVRGLGQGERFPVLAGVPPQSNTADLPGSLVPRSYEDRVGSSALKRTLRR